MKPEVKAQWVAALRSGEYKQGRTQLHTEDGCFCCLGVLCDLGVKTGALEPPTLSRGLLASYGYGRERSHYKLPLEIREWAGLPEYPGVTLAGENRDLAGINDFDRKPFSEIADLIEAQL